MLDGNKGIVHVVHVQSGECNFNLLDKFSLHIPVLHVDINTSSTCVHLYCTSTRYVFKYHSGGAGMKFFETLRTYFLIS